MALKSKRAIDFLNWIGFGEGATSDPVRPRSIAEQPLTDARIVRLRRMGVKGRLLMDAYRRQQR